jgi:hypothetical protein
MPMKKSRTQDTAADFARRSNATSRMNRPPRSMPTDEMPAGGPDASPLAPTSTRDKPVPRPMRTAPTIGPLAAAASRDLVASPRPMPNPRRSDAVDRGNENIRFEQSEQDDVLRGKKFAGGGMVTGSRAQISGTKFSGTF